MCAALLRPVANIEDTTDGLLPDVAIVYVRVSATPLYTRWGFSSCNTPIDRLVLI